MGVSILPGVTDNRNTTQVTQTTGVIGVTEIPSTSSGGGAAQAEFSFGGDSLPPVLGSSGI